MVWGERNIRVSVMGLRCPGKAEKTEKRRWVWPLQMRETLAEQPKPGHVSFSRSHTHGHR